MTNEPLAIEGRFTKISSLADGSIRMQIDIDPAHASFGTIDALFGGPHKQPRVGIAPLAETS